jgi:hypothetical protein
MGAGAADERGMFVHTEETLVLSQACLMSLYASMNAPVVNMDELPVAPARAAIVVYAEEYGDLALAVAVRSLETGQVALYRYRDRVTSADLDAEPMEDAQAFGEGLGFLFDENMLAEDTSAARGAAFAHWNQLAGLAAGADAPAADHAGAVEPDLALGGGSVPVSADGVVPGVQNLLVPVDGAPPGRVETATLDDAAVIEPELELVRSTEPDAPGDDLMLDDLVDLDGDDDFSLEVDEHEPGAETPLEELAGSTIELTGAPPELAPPPAEPSPAPAEAVPQSTEPAVAQGVPLTKFRRATEVADAEGGSQLGRIPIVRLKTGDKSKPSYLGRLLASF